MSLKYIEPVFELKTSQMMKLLLSICQALVRGTARVSENLFPLSLTEIQLLILDKIL